MSEISASCYHGRHYQCESKTCDCGCHERQTETSGINLVRYVVDIFSPEVVEAQEGSAYTWEMSDQRLLANLPAMMEQFEENVQDLLPEGYTLSVTPWKDSDGHL